MPPPKTDEFSSSAMRKSGCSRAIDGDVSRWRHSDAGLQRASHAATCTRSTWSCLARRRRRRHLCWFAPSTTMNPRKLPQSVIDRCSRQATRPRHAPSISASSGKTSPTSSAVQSSRHAATKASRTPIPTGSSVRYAWPTPPGVQVETVSRWRFATSTTVSSISISCVAQAELCSAQIDCRVGTTPRGAISHQRHLFMAMPSVAASLQRVAGERHHFRWCRELNE